MRKINFSKWLMIMLAIAVMACGENDEILPEETNRGEIIQRFYESTVVSSRSPEMSNENVIIAGGIDKIGDGYSVKYGYAWMDMEEGVRKEVFLGSTDEVMDFSVNVTDFPVNKEVGFCVLVALEFGDEEIEDDDVKDIIESEFKTFKWDNQ